VGIILNEHSFSKERASTLTPSAPRAVLTRSKCDDLSLRQKLATSYAGEVRKLFSYMSALRRKWVGRSGY